MVEHAVGIIKSEEDRSHDLAARLKVFPVAKAADHAVRASVPLYLLHPFAVAGLIRKIDTFRDDAITSASCRRKPAFSVFHLRAGRRKTKKVLARKATGGEILKLQTPLAQRPGRKLGPSLLQQIERQKQRRSLLRQFLYAARRGMDALQQVVERKSITYGNDNFAIEDEAFFAQGQCRGNHFRKIAA